LKLDFTTELPYGRLVWADLDHACVWVIQSEYKDHFSVYVIRDFAADHHFGTPRPVIRERVPACLIAIGCRFKDGEWVHQEKPERAYKTQPIPQDDNRTGYVYVLSNPHMPGLVKIGRAADTEQRVLQLSQQSNLPVPFKLERDIHVWDPCFVERWLHKRLAIHRVADNREFFKLTVETACLHLTLAEAVFGAYGQDFMTAAMFPFMDDDDAPGDVK
jgi:hypothetical protein